LPPLIPPERWVEGMPLGNSCVGAMVGGNGHPLIITLDKYDAWETRERILGPGDITYAKLRRMVSEGKRQEVEAALFTALRQWPRPTRLPMPRLEIDFGAAARWSAARLSLYRGIASIRLSLNGMPVTVELWVHARQNLIFIRMTGSGISRATVRLRMDHLSAKATQLLKSIGYADPAIESDARGGTLHWITPSRYEFAVAWRRVMRGPNEQDVCVSVLSNQDADGPLRAARETADRASRTGGELGTHEKWWAEYWQRSFLTIPDARLEALYYMEMYKLGCSLRPGSYPISLQGVWTPDGDMPPWSGDYHLDVNVQESHWPIYAANRLDLGEPFYRMFFECLPRWQRECQHFFGFEGIWAGCAIGPRGERIWGYTGAELWPGNAAWLAHHFWLH